MDHLRQSLKRKDIEEESERGRKIPRLSPSLSASTDGYTPLLVTPPATASLRVVIPRPVLSKDDHRNTKIRQAAALRWVPKLQKPFPKQREINEAYNMKLMRHYKRSTAKPEPNFVKPRIETSSRVMRLLRQFPIRVPTSNGKMLEAGNPLWTYVTDTQITQHRQDAENLQINKRITKSEIGRRLAWQSFSATERDRRDNGRQALMESGLVSEDLMKEKRGIKNGLPEWRKRFTGRYAAERKGR